MLFNGGPDTWDIRWFIGCTINERLTAIPNKNLVVNIGFGEGATHCSSYKLEMVAEHAVGAIDHPSCFLRHAAADEYTFRTVYLPTYARKQSFVVRKFRNALHKLKCRFASIDHQ